MSKTKLLPTSAPKPIPPEFLPKFAAHGWRRVENIWGKSTVLGWSKAIGMKWMRECRAHVRAGGSYEEFVARDYCMRTRTRAAIARARTMGRMPEL